MFFTNPPLGASRFGRVAWYYREGLSGSDRTWILYGDGTMTTNPEGWGAPDAEGVRRWFGPRGDGTAWEWEFHPADLSRLGGGLWWRADLLALWNPKTNEESPPPDWMPPHPGANAFVRWGVVPLPIKHNKSGEVRKNARKSVRISIAYLSPLVPQRPRWYAENLIYQVWPPAFWVR